MDYAEQLKESGRYYTAVKPIPMPITRTELMALAASENDFTKSLIYCLYLTGARVSELNQIKTTNIEYARAPDGQEQVKVKLNTLKKRGRGLPIRDIPIKSANNLEMDMLKQILKHKHTYEKHGTELMYGLSRQYLWRKLKPIKFLTTLIMPKPFRAVDNKEWHLFPHFLRHCRATHLVTEYGFNAFQLQQYMGWSSVIPAAVYVNLDWRDSSRLLLGLNTIGSI